MRQGRSDAHILARKRIDAGRTVMIGDRLHDVTGANANGVAAIGVLWGYGDRAELTAAGATRIAANGRQNCRDLVDEIVHTREAPSPGWQAAGETAFEAGTSHGMRTTGPF